MRLEANVFRVGLTVLAAVAVLAVILLMVGEQSFLFKRTNAYYIRYAQVSGLAVGNPVQLSGVAVGRVREIVLPEDPSEQTLRVWIEVERRYEERIREDSLARIKSLGLLGDKYVQITSGSLDSPPIPPDGEIDADQPTDVDALIATGEDVVDSIVGTARSLSVILDRMERGEGLLGELVADREGRSVTETALETMETVRAIGERIERGEGSLGRLLTDDTLVTRVEEIAVKIDHLVAEVSGGDGLLPALINDAEIRQSFDQTLRDLETTVADLSEVTSDLREGNGLLPRLINDEDLGNDVLEELERLLERLNDVTTKITEGEGTVAQLINDPAIYEALNDIVIGVNESKLLRWLIRNRQNAGIEKRYRDANQESAQEQAPNESEED